jgi:hypothetical protein
MENKKDIKLMIRMSKDNIDKIKNISKSKMLPTAKYCRNLINLELRYNDMKKSYDNYIMELYAYFIDNIIDKNKENFFDLPCDINDMVVKHYNTMSEFKKDYDYLLSEMLSDYMLRFQITEYQIMRQKLLNLLHKVKDVEKKHKELKLFQSYENLLKMVNEKQIDKKRAEKKYLSDYDFIMNG